MIHKVKLRKNKANRKQKADWPLNIEYPVVATEVEHLKTKAFDEDSFQHPLSDGYSKTAEAFDIELDDEDMEEMEALLAKARAKAAAQTAIRTWFLIAHPKKGTYRWVTTEEVKFSSISSG
jgi:hypothetical protein